MDWKTIMLAGHVHGYQAERDAALCRYIEAAMRKIPCWWQDLRLSTVVLCRRLLQSQCTLFLPQMEQEQFCQWRYLRMTFGVTMSFAACWKTMCCEQCHVPLTPRGSRNSELSCTWAWYVVFGRVSRVVLTSQYCWCHLSVVAVVYCSFVKWIMQG